MNPGGYPTGVFYCRFLSLRFFLTHLRTRYSPGNEAKHHLVSPLQLPSCGRVVGCRILPVLL